MPTGYTADLYDGKDVSFRDFVLRCSRAMGAAVMLRDDGPEVVPTPENVSPNTSYTQRRLAEAKGEFEKWKNLVGPGLLAETESFNAKQRQARKGDEEKRERIANAYTSMIEQVEAWDPPTPDHEPLKEFMLQQLRNSLKFDASPTDPKWYAEYTPQDLRDLRIGNLTQEIERLERDGVQEREREASRIQWVEDLYASLPPAPEEASV
jgi:hypothetical protein